MNRKVLLYVGAFINILFAMLHLAFWEMFNWKEELRLVSNETSGVLQILTIASIYMLVFFAGIIFFIAVKNKSDIISNAMLLFISGYFLIRIITGYFYFGFSIAELIIWIVCLVTASIFIYSVFFVKNGSQKNAASQQ